MISVTEYADFYASLQVMTKICREGEASLDYYAMFKVRERGHNMLCYATRGIFVSKDLVSCFSGCIHFLKL
jgi:hypothetical protein